MPAKKETIGIGMKVRPELDQKAVAEVVRDVQSLHKKLSSMRVDWKHVSEEAKANVQEIRNISKAAEHFGKALGKATQQSMDNFKNLGKKLEEAQEKAGAISTAYGESKDPKAKEALAEEMSAVSNIISSLNKQIGEFQKSNYKQIKNVESLTKSQLKFQKSLEQAAEYTGKNFAKDLTSSIGKLGQGGPAGMKGFLGGAAGAAGSGLHGIVARKAQQEQDTGQKTPYANFTNLAKAVPALTAAIVTMTAFWEILKAASQHMTKLNKSLMDGGGFAREASVGMTDYRGSVDRLRESTIASSKELLKYGANSDTAAKAIGAFSRETTGSLQRTEQTLVGLGKGSLQKGANEFAKSAIIYGKALGMEADEVGSMMGKFVSEAGYAGDDVQNVMANVVKAAATSNMPMTKFMDIFRQVLPDVELYRNRLEELTGTIKLLSKTMSAKDVKNFMDAFTKGFGQTDFKQRLKTTLIAGTGFVSKTLDKDFTLKAKSLAKNFAKYGIDEGQMVGAMKKGQKGMAELMAKAQGRASQDGKELDATAVGEAMKLASYEGARQKGGPLNMATAMRGAGMGATYQILKKQSQAFTTGFDGLAEHVIKQTGITEQQYEAMRSFDQSLDVYKSQIKQFGKTQSKSLNDALRKVLADRGETDMTKATETDLIDAATLSNKFDDAAKNSKSVQQLAVEQTTLQTSIDEKIDNVLAFLLEKIYGVLDKSILSTLNDLYEFIALGGKSSASLSSRRVEDSKVTDDEVKTLNESDRGMYEYRQNKLSEIDENAGSKNISLMNGMYSAKDLINVSSKFSEYAKSKALEQGKTEEEAETIARVVQENMSKAAREGDIGKSLNSLSITPGSWKDAFENLNKMIAKEDAQKQEAANNRRTGSKSVAEQEREKAAKEKADILNLGGEVEVLNPLSKAGGGGGGGILKSILGSVPGTGYATSRTSGDGTGAGAVSPAEAVEEHGKAQVEAVKDTKASVVEATSRVQLGIEDLYKLIEKGIKLEPSFLSSAYSKTLKEATLESFRTALLEFAVIEAKMANEDDLSDFGKELAGRGKDLYDAGGTLEDIMGVNGGDGSFDSVIEDLRTRGSRQTGGPIPDTGYYRLHRGEYVVPAMPAQSKSGGNGSGSPIVHLTINGTGLSQQQLEGAVYTVMDKHARKS